LGSGLASAEFVVMVSQKKKEKKKSTESSRVNFG
jgi:hypothetical protein